MTRRADGAEEAGVVPLKLSGSACSASLTGRVVKRYRDGVTRELAKASDLVAIGTRHGFLAPAVLEFDESNRTITYQWIEGLTPLRDLYLAYMSGTDRGDRCQVAVRIAGSTLAVLHRELNRAGAVEWTPPVPFAREALHALGPQWRVRLGESPQVALHCDYGFGNVHLAADATPRIALLDPSPNYYLTFDPLTVGSAYLDLATLLACLWGLVPLREYLRLNRSRVGVLVGALREGYERAAGWRLDRELLDGVTSAVVATYLTRRLGSGLLAVPAARMIGRAARRGTGAEG